MKEDILHSALKEVQIFGDIKSHKAEIDAEDLSWILQILSTNLYSDPIGSLIREYSSNAWDANIEAGNADKPIEVGIQTTPDKGTYWYVTDLGPGLSPQRINDVYRKFGKSTKRNSNEAIGMMGLGKFSGLSYTNEIFITTRVDGVQYEYLMHKSEGVPQIDLLITKLVDLPNGTTIKVNIKDWSDRRQFVQKTKEQLAFFENVYFNIDDQPYLNEKFKVYKAKTFTYSTLESRDLRLKIGPVSYPIDWDVISKSTPLKTFDHVLSGIAINFKIGDLAITPNRESILYNKQTLENIAKAFEATCQEIADLYDKNIDEYEDIEKFVDAINNPAVKIGDRHFKILPILQATNTPVKHPRLKGLAVDVYPSNSAQQLFYGYTCKTVIRNGRKNDRDYSKNISFYPNQATQYLLVENIALNPAQNKYISETFNNNEWYVIRKVKTILKAKDNSTLCYYKLLGLDSIPKAKWRDTIKTFQKWQYDYITKHSVKYDDHVPPKTWVKVQKTATAKPNTSNLRKLTGKILVKLPERAYGYSNYYVYKGKDWELKSLPKQKKYIIYGLEDDKETLEKLQHFAPILKDSFTTLVTAKSNHKYLQLLPNAMEVNEFINAKIPVFVEKKGYKYFGKFMSLLKLVETFNSLDNLYNTIELIKYLNTPFYKAFKEMQKLYVASKTTLPTSDWEKDKWKELLESMTQIAEAHNIHDPEIEALIKVVTDYAKQFEYLIHVKGSTGKWDNGKSLSDYNKAQKEFAVFVCKAKKVKLDLIHYQPKQDEQINDDSEEV